MKPVLFLFYLQMIYTSHTFLKLLTHTPHRHHWYFPSSVVTELHLLPHASPSSTHSSMSAVDPPTVRAYSSSPRTNEKEMQLHPTHRRRFKVPPHAYKAHLTSNIFDPSLPCCWQNTSLKPTLYNTQSTQDRSHCRRWRSSPPLKTDLHLFPDLSLFPSFSHSFFLLSSSLWIKNIFILIFGCVKCIFWNF